MSTSPRGQRAAGGGSHVWKAQGERNEKGNLAIFPWLSPVLWGHSIDSAPCS